MLEEVLDHLGRVRDLGLQTRLHALEPCAALALAGTAAQVSRAHELLPCSSAEKPIASSGFPSCLNSR